MSSTNNKQSLAGQNIAVTDPQDTTGVFPNVGAGYWNGTGDYVRTSSSNPFPVTTTGTPAALGQTTMALSSPVVLASNQSAVTTRPAVAATVVVLGSATGSSTSASATIASSTVAAGLVFTGNVMLSLAACTASSANASSLVRAVVNWNPQSGGTPTQAVAALNLAFAANVTADGFSNSTAVVVPVTVYAGAASSGSFGVTVTQTGTTQNITWDAVVSGIAQ